MKKALAFLLTAIVTMVAITGCSSAPADTSSPAATGSSPAATTSSSPAASALTGDISVVSREDGSGTRGAFIELFEILVEGDDGSETDTTTKDAIIANSTDVTLTNITSDPNAIGYVSLGSMNETVKALAIDGVAATAENVKNETYKVARPFNIATKGEASGLAADFTAFIMSADGQKVIVDGGYIAVDDAAKAYAGDKPSGKITVAGSSSVTPIMEKLKEAYIAINPDAQIDIQMSDSSAGMTAAIDGTCDIGMASRELKDTELAELTSTSIAIDGIAVIVNTENPVSEMTSEQVKNIFTGATTTWDAI